MAFKTYKNMWNVRNHGVKVRKEDLANWMSLVLKKALTIENIKAGFKGPLNFEAMQDKMGPSEGFLPRNGAEIAQEEEDIAQMMD